MRSFGSYDQALLYERKLTELETDTSDTPHQMGRGQRKRKRKVFSDTDSCSSQDEDLPDPPMPPPPIIQKNISKVIVGYKEDYSSGEWNNIAEKFFDLSDNERIISRHNTSVSTTRSSQSNTQVSNSQMQQILHLTTDDTQGHYDTRDDNDRIICQQNNITAPTTFTSDRSQKNASSQVQQTYVTTDETRDASLLKTILETVVSTKMMVAKLATKLEKQNYNISSVEYNEELSKLPLKTQDDLQEFNTLITHNNIIKSDFFHMLLSVGGQDIKKCIKRTLQKVFSDTLATKCSWTGAKNNYAINKLLIVEVMQSVVKTNFPMCTDSLYEETLKDWFRYATQRLKRKDQLQD